MILGWWKEKTRIREICGIEILIEDSGEIIYQICHVSLIKDRLSILSQHSNLNSKEFLKIISDIKVPLAVNFSGSGIITKVVSAELGTEGFKTAFPGLDFEKFFIQECLQITRVFVSLINRKIINEMLSKIGHKLVINLSLCGFVLPLLKEQTNLNDSQFTMSGHLLTFDGDTLISYEYVKATENAVHAFNGVRISSAVFNAFAQAFQLFFFPQLLPVCIEGDKYNLLSDFLRYSRLKIAGLIGTSALLLVLLINFFLWSTYSNKLNVMETEQQLNVGVENNRVSVTQRTELKEKQLLSLGILPISYEEIYREVGLQVYPGITLNAIEINPEDADSLEYGVIEIKGGMEDVSAYEEFKSNLSKSRLGFSIKHESFFYNKNKEITNFQLFLVLFKDESNGSENSNKKVVLK